MSPRRVALALILLSGHAGAAEPENAREIREGFEPTLPGITQDVVREKAFTRALREPDRTAADSDVAIVRTLFQARTPSIKGEHQPPVPEAAPETIEIHGDSLPLGRVLSLIGRSLGHEVAFADDTLARTTVRIPSGRFPLDLLFQSIEEQARARIHHYPEGRTFIVTAPEAIQE